MFDPGERTHSGLSLDDVRDLMAARVTVWADLRHAQRLEREAKEAAALATRVVNYRAHRVRSRAAAQKRYWARRKAEAEAAP